jgi:hypothetical protein
MRTNCLSGCPRANGRAWKRNSPAPNNFGADLISRNGDDQPWRFRRAAEWLRQLPEFARGDFYCTLVAGDLEAVSDFLRRDPTLARRDGCPRNWPPLMYVTSSRVEQNKEHAVAVARLLLELWASPDSYSKEPSGFTALTGAIGGGERGPIACPAHACADELVMLLLNAGANPNQSHALYNTMLGEHLDKWPPILVQYGQHGHRGHAADRPLPFIFHSHQNFRCPAWSAGS